MKRIILALLCIPLFLQNGYARNNDLETENSFSNPSIEINTEPVDSALAVDAIFTQYDAAPYSPGMQYTMPEPKQPSANNNFNDFLQPSAPSDFPGIEPVMQFTDGEIEPAQMPPLPPGLEYDLPPLPPGYEYDLPPLPREFGEYMTSYPVKNTMAAVEPTQRPEESIAQPQLTAPAQEETLLSILPPLPPGLEYDLPPLPAEFASYMPSFPVKNTIPTVEQSATNEELTAPQVDSLFINELDRLGRDSVGKEYHDDLAGLIQLMKTDPQAFSTNAMLQAKFDSVLERAARDEAAPNSAGAPDTSITPMQAAGPTNVITPAIAAAPIDSATATFTHNTPALGGTESSQNFLFDYDPGLAPGTQTEKPNYVEDWPSLEKASLEIQETPQGASSPVITSHDNGQVSTQEPDPHNKNIDDLKETLISLKGTSYEQDAQNILTQIKTNAPPELYANDLKALIQRIDTAAGIQPQETKPSPDQTGPNVALLLTAPSQTITIPAIAYDSQSRENRVTRATSPR